MSDDLYDDIHLPQPEEVTEKDRENAFGSYILMFAGAYFPLPFIEIVLSFIYYNYFKKRSRYVAFHTYQSLLSQIPITIFNTSFFAYAIYLFVLLVRGNEIPEGQKNWFFILLAALVLLNILYNIISLVVAIKAKKGVIKYFPYIGIIAYNKVYGAHAIKVVLNEKKSESNSAPS